MDSWRIQRWFARLGLKHNACCFLCDDDDFVNKCRATLDNCDFKWPRALETLASVFTLQQGKIEI